MSCSHIRTRLQGDHVGSVASIIAEAERGFAPYDAILMPTVPCIAPRIADLEATDGAYFAANALILRNPSVINFLDGCALSVPCHAPGEAPVGLMIAGLAMQDLSILSIGAAIEAVLAANGRAIHYPQPVRHSAAHA